MVIHILKLSLEILNLDEVDHPFLVLELIVLTTHVAQVGVDLLDGPRVFPLISQLI